MAADSLELQQRRRRRVATAMWLGANVVVTTILTGMLLVPDLPFLRAMTLVLVGSILGVGLRLVGLMGTRTRLPTMVLARGAFGMRGSNPPAAVNMVILIG